MVRKSIDTDASRRTVLKTLGASATLGSVPAIASARPSSKKGFKNLWQAGLKIRRNAGTDKWYQWLDAKGFTFRSKKLREYLPSEGSVDGPSSQELPKDYLDLILTVGKHDGYEGTHAAHMHWDWTVMSRRFGDSPKDPVTIGWNDNFYDLESTYTDDVDYQDYEDDYINFWDTNNSSGATWKYYDNEIGGEGTWSCGCGTYMNALDSDSSLRDVEFKYYHTWSNVSIDGVSFGGGAPTVSFGSDSKRWLVRQEVDEGERYP